jgi:hypothetical protein
LFDACPIVNGGQVNITRAFVSPASGRQGATFNIIMNYRVIKNTGPGMFFVYPSSPIDRITDRFDKQACSLLLSFLLMEASLLVTLNSWKDNPLATTTSNGNSRLNPLKASLSPPANTKFKLVSCYFPLTPEDTWNTM